jgi:hypothetical protein
VWRRRSGGEREAKRDIRGGRDAARSKKWEGRLTRGLHSGVVGIKDKI